MVYQYCCEACSSVIQVPRTNMHSICQCPICQHVQVPAQSNHSITNKNVRNGLFKGYGIAVLVAVIGGGLFSGIVPLLIGAAIAMAVVILPVWFMTNVGMDLLHKTDRGYLDYRKNGGSPFWDNFLNAKGETNYVLPNPEPEYTKFVPPRFWRFQCNTCNARVEGTLNPCWNCNIHFD